jgi:hypothetical protein
MVNFSSIPVDVFRAIAEYLTLREYGKLMISRKLIFEEIKERTVHYSILVEVKRHQLVDNQLAFCMDGFAFYNKLRTRNEVTSKQIKITIRGGIVGDHGSFDNVKTFFSTFRHLAVLHLEEVDFLSSLVELPLGLIVLSLTKIRRLTDISGIQEMKNLRKCSVICCESLKNISPLKDIHEVVLTLPACSPTVSQSDLFLLQGGKCEKFFFAVELDDLMDIVLYDISFLSNVTQEISVTAFISKSCDLSSVANVKKLSLTAPLKDSERYGTDNNRKFMKFFNGNSLSLSCEIEFDPSFAAPNLEELRCNGFYDISISNFLQCSNLRVVYFSHWREDGDGVLDVGSHFRRLTSLEINGSGLLLSTVGFGGIERLTLSECYKLPELSGLGNGNQFVKLHRLSEVKDFSPLNGIHKVEISGCYHLVTGNGLENVKHLTIKDCLYFSDCSSLFNNNSSLHSVKLYGLPMLTSLIASGNNKVNYLKICKCRNLANLAIDTEEMTNVTEDGYYRFAIVEDCEKILDKDKSGTYDILKQSFHSFIIR